MKLLATPLLLTVLSLLSGMSSAQFTVAFPAWSPHPVAATLNIQQAVDSGVDFVILLHPPGTNAWVIRSVNLHSSQEIQLAAGVVVRNDPSWTGPAAGEDIFHAAGITGAAIRGNAGNPARIELVTAGALGGLYQGHCVELVGCAGVELENLILTSNFGDGITLNEGPGMVPCTDVTIRNCVSTGCARVGLAITNADGVLVEDCQFIGTGVGTPPTPIVGWGMDLEPDHALAHLSGITIRNCVSTGNKEDGFRVWLQKLVPTSAPVDIVFEDCRVEANTGHAYQVNCNVFTPASGTVRFEECTAFDVDGAGASVILSYYLTPFSMKVVFDRCRWTTVAKVPSTYVAPIYLATTDGTYSSTASGVDFLNCIVDDNLVREPVIVNLGPPYTVSHADILGRLTVHNPSVVPLSPSVLPNLQILYMP